MWYKIKGRLFRKNLTRNFRMIYFARITLNSATQLMGLFLPIFLYQFLGFSLPLVIIYYLISDLLYASLVVVGCQQIMNRIGIRRSLQLSIFFGSVYYGLFFIINRYLLADELLISSRFWYILPTIFFSLLFRLAHWIPFHTNVAKLTDRHTRASQLSFLEASMLALGAVMPLVAGVSLEYFGYGFLFLLAIVIYLLSLIPFSRIPEVKERFTWTYRQTWHNFLDKKNRSGLLAYAGDGAESVIGSVIWPIFLWQLFEGNYLQVGLISSIVILVTIILQIAAGSLMDKRPNRQRWLKFSVFFYSLGWILKALIQSAFQVFLFSTYHNLSRVFARTSFDALNYDIAADQGQYVDEYTVLREMAIVFGKAMMCVLVLIMYPFFTLRYLFIVAALASLSMSLLSAAEVDATA